MGSKIGSRHNIFFYLSDLTDLTAEANFSHYYILTSRFHKFGPVWQSFEKASTIIRCNLFHKKKSKKSSMKKKNMIPENDTQGRIQDLVQGGAHFQICSLSTARSAVFCFRATREKFWGVLPPPEQVLPPPRNINYD